ncbi:hypothetical protein GWI33_009875 [Rhynchophorus ferrugineus]|uniref:Odorant receptor n=1 Tax=Rhynchophorus ferrugineus TaxID=354439 RepID=A0A834MAJ1_RHYFE|nr:hypothetical protein GWI33_009875 [Rhynchophorus ferrugineus]
MEPLKWKNAFKTSQSLLTWCEVWILDKKRTWISNIKTTFFALATIIFDITLLMEMQLLFNRRDYEAISIHLATLSLYVGFTIKIIMFMRKTEQLRNLIELFDWPGLDDIPAQFQQNKTRSIMSSNFISRFYFITVSFNITLYLNRPLYSSYFEYPIEFSYPLPYWGKYCLIALQVFCVYYTVLVGIAFDLLHASLARTATELLDILCKTITSFKPVNKDNPEAEELKFLTNCAIKHRHIIRKVVLI